MGNSSLCCSDKLVRDNSVKVDLLGEEHIPIQETKRKMSHSFHFFDSLQNYDTQIVSNSQYLRVNEEKKITSKSIQINSRRYSKNYNSQKMVETDIEYKSANVLLTEIDNLYHDEKSKKNNSLIDKSRLNIQIVSRKKAYKHLPKFSFNKFGGDNIDDRNMVSYGKELDSENYKISELNTTVKEVLSKVLNNDQIEFVKKILFEEEILTKDMEEETINDILASIIHLKISPNTIIYSKGSPDNVYYIIESGKLEYKIDDKVDYLVRGDCIGTKALEKQANKECLAMSVGITYLFSLSLEAYKSSLHRVFQRDRDEKMSVLNGMNIFRYLEKTQIFALANCVKKCYYKELIVSEDETPNKMYIIIDGNVVCIKNNNKVKVLHPKEYFCDAQLFCYMESYYNYFAEEIVLLYELDYKDIIQSIGSDYIQKIIFSVYKHSIQVSEQLSKHLTGKNLNNLFEIFQLKYYHNEVVFTSKIKKLCVVISGKLKKSDNTECVVANVGDLYGELFIDSVDNSESSIITDDECITFEAEWHVILRSLKCISNRNVSIYERINLMKSLPFFSKLSELKLFQLAELLKTYHYKKGEILIKDGPISNKLYIIKQGKVKIFINNILIKELENLSSFGDISNENSIDSYSKKATFIASDKLECYTLDKDAYEEVIDSSIFKPLQKILVLKDITVQLDQLYYLKQLGFGSYGKVYLVHNQKNFFAIKSSEIHLFFKSKRLTRYVYNEKCIMSSIDHPFIVQLVNTLKNQDYIFFLLEFIDGPSLKQYMMHSKRDSIRNSQEVTFYGAILITILNYLQRKRIIHRDMKPDNCMIDNKGYLKLIDFGVAKELLSKDFTHTILGTPHYMAPEVLVGKGYNFSVDYWGVGVILYELFYGTLPFGNNSLDLCEIYREIIEKKLVIPYDTRFRNLNNFLNIILYKNPSKRVCSYKKLKNHSIFENFDFAQLLEFKIIPPFIPESTNSDKINLLNLDYPFVNFIRNNINSTFVEIKEEEELSLNKKRDLLSDF